MTYIEKGLKVPFSACLLTDRGPKVYNSQEWQINVSSEKQQFTVTLKANEQASEGILTNQLVSLVIALQKHAYLDILKISPPKKLNVFR